MERRRTKGGVGGDGGEGAFWEVATGEGGVGIKIGVGVDGIERVSKDVGIFGAVRGAVWLASFPIDPARGRTPSPSVLAGARLLLPMWPHSLAWQCKDHLSRF